MHTYECSCLFSDLLWDLGTRAELLNHVRAARPRAHPGAQLDAANPRGMVTLLNIVQVNVNAATRPPMHVLCAFAPQHTFEFHRVALSFKCNS